MLSIGKMVIRLIDSSVLTRSDCSLHMLVQFTILKINYKTLRFEPWMMERTIRNLSRTLIMSISS
jgi:hypothetical protein